MKLRQVYLLIFSFLISFTFISAQTNSRKLNRKTISKPQIKSANNFDGNHIDCDMENNGMFVSYNISGRSGLTWPKGNNTQTVFASGVWLGGIVNDTVRVSAAEYGGEYASGPWGADHGDPKHKIYKVSKSDLVDPINNSDIQNWPVELGAPWVDENKNGTYEPFPDGPDHPEFIGDQVLWMVMNDGVDSLHSVFHTDPLGVEVQRTVFGFDRTDAFGDMMFVKDLIINKGGNTIEKMYVGLWSDPDLGDAGDDFVGCDTLLSLGICYNDGIDREFADYVNGTPAVGYDFFQGPIVPAPGETAYMFGRNIPNMRNLKMTSFIKYIGGDPVYYDPNNAEEAYNYMKGFLPDGSLFPIISTGGSKFVHPGNPTKDTGLNDTEYVDKDLHQSGDRRFLMSSGPFTMAPGDSQEVVYGIINVADGGWDDSYLKLKEVDIVAQNFYDHGFQPPPPPPKPQISVTALDDQIILTWNDKAENYESENYFDVHPETGAPTKYKFEGYNVYQLESLLGIGEAKRIVTFDKINGVRKILDDVFIPEYGKYVNIFVQHGSDSGLSHSIQITQDALNDIPYLKINREYYFAVSAYAYNKYGIPKTLESIKEIIAVRPQVPNTWSANSDTIQHGYSFEAEHIKGGSNGSVSVRVIDPTQITGDTYKVTFNDYLINSTDTLNITNWDLTNTATGERLLSNQVIVGGVNNVTGETLGINSTPIINGFQVIVNSVEPDIDYVAVVANAAGPIDPPVDGLAYWRYPDWLVENQNYDNAVSQITDAVWFLNTHPGYGPGGPETFYNSVVVYSGGNGSPNQGITALIPYDYECRFTGLGKAFDYFNGTGVQNVPFEWWNIGFGTPEDPIDDYKLISYFIDDNGDGVWSLNAVDHETSGGDNDPYTDRIYVMAPTNDTPGTQGHDDFFTNVLPDGSNVAEWTSAPGENDPGGPMDTWNVFSRLVFMNWNGGDAFDPTFPANINALEPEAGTVFRIVTTKPNTSNDEFTFSTASLVGKTIEYHPSKIKVWPNPYFGYNPEEKNADDRQIHFTHLPEDGKCILRIFDLTGKLVRKLEHTNGTQYDIWDVRDYNTKPVASGMYIVHIETDQGDKILKLAVIQPQ